MSPAPNIQTISISNRQIRKIATALRKQPESATKGYLNMLLVPIIVTVLGAWAAQRITKYYNQQQMLLAQNQVAESYIKYFDRKNEHSPQQRYMAIQSLIG